MQRYYFNFFDGTRWLNDNVGQEIESLHKVYTEAGLALIDLSKYYISVENSLVLLYDIIDENGNKICEVKLSLEKEIFASAY